MSYKMYSRAAKHLGEKETPGQGKNLFIMECLASVKLGHLNDETSWCSGFVNLMAKLEGLEHTNNATARSWLNVGEEVRLEDAEKGDIVIFWRESKSSWKGHVALFSFELRGRIHHLGGNQSDKVSIASTAASRLLGVRRLKKIK